MCLTGAYRNMTNGTSVRPWLPAGLRSAVLVVAILALATTGMTAIAPAGHAGQKQAAVARLAALDPSTAPSEPVQTPEPTPAACPGSTKPPPCLPPPPSPSKSASQIT